MLIAIEGIDGSGKHTQAKMLADALRKQHGNAYARMFSFPRYNNSISSRFIQDYLKGAMGGVYDNIPLLTALPYALDRFEWLKEMRGLRIPWDSRRDFTICDRWVASNIAHQCGKVYSPDCGDWEKLATDIENVEYKILGLPKADITILLNMSATVSKTRTDGRGDAADIHQDDVGYLSHVAAVYRALAHGEGWVTIDLLGDGARRTKEDINDEIMQILAERCGWDQP
jgi:dTMP kinase